MIRGYGINQAYINACYELMEHPEYESAPRGMPIKEITNAVIQIENPYKRVLSVPSRDLSLRYLAGELSFYLAGSDDLEFIAHYSAFWRKISDDGHTVNSAYGKRLFKDKWGGATPFQYALLQLLSDRDTRKAVMMIYEPNDSDPDSKDNPCTLSLQFMIRGGALHLTVSMRSNDVWLGTPYDIAFFAFVQERMLVAYNAINLTPILMGSYTHFVGSLHCYERNWEEATSVIINESDLEKEGQEMPRMGESFEIELPEYLRMERALRTGTHDVTMLTDPMLIWMTENVRREK